MNKILIIILCVSIALNFTQFNQKKTLLIGNNIVEDKKSSSVNKNCYIMYVNYFMNSEDGIEFTLPPVQECLLQDIFKGGYQYDGVNITILNQLSRFQDKHPNSKSIILYIDALKNRFYIKTDTINYDAMKIALKIIGDKNFEEKVIEEGIYNFSNN